MTAREPREITLAEIKQTFELASYWFGGTWCPAVARTASGGYRIRLLKSETLTQTSRSETYEYFELDAEGLITVAPRGYARQFKPGRIVDAFQVRMGAIACFGPAGDFDAVSRRVGDKTAVYARYLGDKEQL